MSDLDSILAGEVTAPVVEAPESVEPVVEAAPDVIPKVEEAAPTAAKEEHQPWQMAAVLDERQKRQALQRELDEANAKLAAKSEVVRPDVFEDQDGAFAHLESKVSNMLMKDRLNLSREMMSMTKNDYLEMENVFVEMAKADPALTREMLAHPNPARFAYETAVKKQEYANMQNIDEYKAKLRAEVRAEVERELQGATETHARSEARKSGADVPSLANASASSGGFATPSDLSLADILRRA